MADVPPTAPALVDQIAARFTESHAANVETAHASLAALIDTTLEAHESDLAKLTGPILAAHIETLDLPEPVRAMFDVLLDPSHQTQFFTALFAVKSIIDQFVNAAIQPAVQNVSNAVWPHDPSRPLSPEAAAVAVLKGKVGLDWAHAQAAESGTHPNVLDIMVAIAGEPISLQEALLLYRRGQITEARLLTAVRESRVRDEWFPEVLALRFAPPPAGEVIAGSLKGHLSDADARDKLGEAGIQPDNFDWMRATAGRPPGIEQMLHLWNRGHATESDVDQAVRQSDINDHYLPFVKQLRVYVPPVRSIMPMLRAGVITDARAAELLAENGVRAEDIPLYIAEGHHTKTEQIKDLSQAQTIRLYEARFIDRGDAASRLLALGYDHDTAALLLDFADEARHERYVNAIVTRVHARYVGYKLTAPEVHTALSADGVPPAAITDLLRLWDIERDANYHVLTPAAIVGAYRRQQIDAAETRQRLLAVGVQPADIELVVADGFAPSKVPQALVDAVVNA